MVNTTKNTLIKFLFPFWPIKVFKTTKTIFVFAFLIALSILLNLINIKIIGGISLSFAWLPVIIIGWYFGPVIGLIMGGVIDTINWLIYGGVWFWLYAIQEPLIGLITGFFVSCYLLINKIKNHFKINFTISQIILVIFLIFSITFVFYFSNPKNNLINSNLNSLLLKTNQIIKWLIIGFLILFFTIIESIVIFKIIEYKKQSKPEILENFLFISTLMIVLTTIFSYLLGPISAIEFYKFLNKTSYVPNLINYGYIYFLLPRIIKECFKTPIYITLLSLIICGLDPLLIRLKNSIHNSYIQY